MIDQDRDHMGHLIGFDKRRGQLGRPNSNVMQRRIRGAMPRPLHQLDQRHALRDAGKRRHRGSSSSVLVIRPRLSSSGIPALAHSIGMMVSLMTLEPMRLPRNWNR